MKSLENYTIAGTTIAARSFAAAVTEAIKRGLRLGRGEIERRDVRGVDFSGYRCLSEVSFDGTLISGCTFSQEQMFGVGFVGYVRSLRYARLSGPAARKMFGDALPSGKLIGYKKVYLRDAAGHGRSAIAVLEIPAKARRMRRIGCTTAKCRAEYAKVLRIETLNGRSLPRTSKLTAHSMHAPQFIYRVGKIVRPKNRYCDKPQQECAGGIHFFLTRTEAVAY